MSKLIDKNPANMTELQTYALDAISNLREAYTLDAQNLPNLDRLALTMSYAQVR